jgi:uncharacterized protein YceK
VRVKLCSLLFAIASLVQSGCGTLINLDIKDGGRVSEIYGGVRFDIEIANNQVQGARDGGQRLFGGEHGPVSCLVTAIAIGLIDVPICAVLDTATLPFTIYATIERGTLKCWSQEFSLPVSAPDADEQPPSAEAQKNTKQLPSSRYPIP